MCWWNSVTGCLSVLYEQYNIPLTCFRAIPALPRALSDTFRYPPTPMFDPDLPSVTHLHHQQHPTGGGYVKVSSESTTMSMIMAMVTAMVILE